MSDDAIHPFRIEVPQADLDDLKQRLANTRWAGELPLEPSGPQRGPVPPGWEYGVPLSYVRRLAEYWRDRYDWRAWEARINAWPQFTTEIDGQHIHFIHARSAEAGALPLILTHGWPGSIVEYLDVIAPLTDPRAHGGEPDDAFDLVIPSLPGFAFSGATSERGWSRYRTARAWAELMRRLGYERYGAAGNDVGSEVSPEVGRADPDHVIGVHVTQLFSFPSGDPAELADLSEEDLALLQFLKFFDDNMSAFNKLQSSQPQTLAHALADSPVGQLAWSGQLFGPAVDDDFALTNITIYWLTNTAASASRKYYEDSHAPEHPSGPTTVPTGLASFANDFRPVRCLAERDHANIVTWNMYDTGGHYAAHQVPELLVSDIRDFYRRLR